MYPLTTDTFCTGAYFFDRRSRSFRRIRTHPFPLCDEGLLFAFGSEPAAGRTIRINPVEFAFQLLTPQGVLGGRLGEFALQLLSSLRVLGGGLGQFTLQLLGMYGIFGSGLGQFAVLLL